MRIASVGHAVFAATMIALGLLGLVQGDFVQIWQPVPRGVPGREGLIYLCAAIALTCGMGLLWRRAATIAARVLFIYLMVWMLLFKAVFIVLAPTVEGTWLDDRGMFLATVDAGPVYRLLGKRGLSATEFPPMERPVNDGDLAFRQPRAGQPTAPNRPHLRGLPPAFFRLLAGPLPRPARGASRRPPALDQFRHAAPLGRKLADLPSRGDGSLHR